jgi:uncharacterized protein (DUF2141 family)
MTRRIDTTILLAATVGALALAAAPRAGAQAAGGALRVVVTGVRDGAGVVRVHLWDGPSGYPATLERSRRRGAAKVEGGRAVVEFDGLAPGRWAAFAFHDEDADGRVRSNFLGMPKEGVGASRGARGRMGPPSFEDAAFDHGAADQTQPIALRYL